MTILLNDVPDAFKTGVRLIYKNSRKSKGAADNVRGDPIISRGSDSYDEIVYLNLP